VAIEFVLRPGPSFQVLPAPFIAATQSWSTAVDAKATSPQSRPILSPGGSQLSRSPSPACLSRPSGAEVGEEGIPFFFFEKGRRGFLDGCAGRTCERFLRVNGLFDVRNGRFGFFTYHGFVTITSSSCIISRDIDVSIQISKFSNKFEIVCSVTLFLVCARETRLPVGNHIYRPVTEFLEMMATNFCISLFTA
jgi:hypothetical protein